MIEEVKAFKVNGKLYETHEEARKALEFLTLKRWRIKHPGTSETLYFVGTFKEVMTKWFEGWNVPVLMNDGKVCEDFSASYSRVSEFMKSGL